MRQTVLHLIPILFVSLDTFIKEYSTLVLILQEMILLCVKWLQKMDTLKCNKSIGSFTGSTQGIPFHC